MTGGERKGVRIISFKLDLDTLMLLDTVAAKSRKYRSELIRDAIRKYLEVVEKLGS
ncbi:MAG: ribbon-helix-helix protein, CopG family [Acidilobus sp.]